MIEWLQQMCSQFPGSMGAVWGNVRMGDIHMSELVSNRHPSYLNSLVSDIGIHRKLG